MNRNRKVLFIILVILFTVASAELFAASYSKTRTYHKTINAGTETTTFYEQPYVYTYTVYFKIKVYKVTIRWSNGVTDTYYEYVNLTTSKTTRRFVG